MKQNPGCYGVKTVQSKMKKDGESKPQNYKNNQSQSFFLHFYDFLFIQVKFLLEVVVSGRQTKLRNIFMMILQIIAIILRMQCSEWCYKRTCTNF